MSAITAADLAVILAEHLKWARGEPNGKRADLTDANLTYANLTYANLTDANLRDANLTRANLSDANLTDANLTDANLSDANLTRANLSGANLPHTQVCPEEGAFIGWKKLRDGLIAKLAIGANCERVSPIVGRKCRADAAMVLRIEAPDGTDRKEGESIHRGGFVYRVGEPVQADTYDPNPLVECRGGIHFFISRREAQEYV